VAIKISLPGYYEGRASETNVRSNYTSVRIRRQAQVAASEEFLHRTAHDQPHPGVSTAPEILELTTASRQGKLQNPEELHPQASAKPGVDKN
jgi:hypothetical protein